MECCIPSYFVSKLFVLAGYFTLVSFFPLKRFCVPLLFTGPIFPQHKTFNVVVQTKYELIFNKDGLIIHIIISYSYLNSLFSCCNDPITQ